MERRYIARVVGVRPEIVETRTDYLVAIPRLTEHKIVSLRTQLSLIEETVTRSLQILPSVVESYLGELAFVLHRNTDRARQILGALVGEITSAHKTAALSPRLGGTSAACRSSVVETLVPGGGFCHYPNGPERQGSSPNQHSGTPNAWTPPGGPNVAFEVEH